MSETKIYNSTLRDSIWMTSKTRMFSEDRYKRYSFLSHLLLSYYSLVMIIISVFSDALSCNVPMYKEVTISFAIVLFGITLIVTGFQFDDVAKSHRECYLRLQKLLSEDLPDDALSKNYHEVLAGYPNHRNWDYDNFIIDRTFIRGESITKGGEVSVKPTTQMYVMKVLRFSFFWCIISLLFFVPIFTFIFSVVGG